MFPIPLLPTKNVVLYAEDDPDDQYIFHYAFQEFSSIFDLMMVNNGEQLIEVLNGIDTPLPHAVFLDMNMPRMNGLECLLALKACEPLKAVPVIMMSTSFNPSTIKASYEAGAHYYLQKPSDMVVLGKMIHHVLLLLSDAASAQPPYEAFILTPQRQAHGHLA